MPAHSIKYEFEVRVSDGFILGLLFLAIKYLHFLNFSISISKSNLSHKETGTFRYMSGERKSFPYFPTPPCVRFYYLLRHICCSSLSVPPW